MVCGVWGVGGGVWRLVYLVFCFRFVVFFVCEMYGVVSGMWCLVWCVVISRLD